MGGGTGSEGSWRRKLALLMTTFPEKRKEIDHQTLEQLC